MPSPLPPWNTAQAIQKWLEDIDDKTKPSNTKAKKEKKKKKKDKEAKTKSKNVGRDNTSTLDSEKKPATEESGDNNTRPGTPISQSEGIGGWMGIQKAEANHAALRAANPPALPLPYSAPKDAKDVKDVKDAEEKEEHNVWEEVWTFGCLVQ